MKLPIPLILTGIRIAVAPFLAYDIALGEYKRATVLFCIAAATDFLDGFCARLLNQETKLGQILDPFADKLLIISCYGAFFYTSQLPGWFLLGMAIKELLLVSGGLYDLLRKKSMDMRPHITGKVAMLVNVLCIACFCLCRLFNIPVQLYSWTSVLLVGILIISYVPLIFYGTVNYRRIIS